jgi:hypothetical protein
MAYDATLGVDEKMGSLFQPDALLPAQYLETFRRKAQLEPEKRLILAILEEAVHCFQKYVFVRDARGKTIFAAAEQWLMEETGDWIFSFDNVCDALGFNPSYVRQGLLRWKQMKRAKRSKSKNGRGLRGFSGGHRETRRKVLSGRDHSSQGIRISARHLG